MERNGMGQETICDVEGKSRLASETTDVKKKISEYAENAEEREKERNRERERKRSGEKETNGCEKERSRAEGNMWTASIEKEEIIKFH